jgi:hypothetical protein
MKNKNKHQTGRNLYIFNVDLMVDSESNALALEQLISALNRGGFVDYRIISGIETGRLIQQVTQGPYQLNPVTIPPQLAQGKPAAAPEPDVLPQAGGKSGKQHGAAGQAKGAAKQSDSPGSIGAAMDRIRDFIAGNRLVRLNVNRGRGVKLSVPCRIINLDESMYSVTVYHVDEKKVYTFGLFEIDDFIET